MEKITGKLLNLICASLLLVCWTSHAQPTVTNSGCASVPGLIGWWPAQGDATDLTSTNNGSVKGGLTYTNGVVGSAFGFNGTDSEVDFGTDIGNFGTNDFTVEFWIQTTSALNLQSCLEKHGICNAGHFWDIRIGNCNGCNNKGTGHIVFELYGCPDYVACGTWVPVTGGTAINDGVWHHIACVRTGITSLVYVDGNLDGSGTTFTGQVADVSNTAMFRAGQNTCQCCDGTRAFNGNLDEISLYNRALSLEEVQSIYQAGSAGKCPAVTTPSIVKQPTDITAAVGSTVKLTVGATGAAPLTYQWFLNSNPVGVTTVPQLVITNVQLSDNGSYWVVVSNAYDSVQSATAALTVFSPTCATVAGLIGWWPGEENASDMIGTNNGIVSGGLTYTTGAVGSAFAFNGTDSEVDFGTDVGNFGTNDFTVEFWIQTTSTVNLQSCLEKHGICDASRFWDIRIGNCNGCNNQGTGHVVFELYGCPDYVGCGTWVPVTGGTAINDGVWHHVACVRTGITSMVYVDGNLDGSGTTYTGQVADVSNNAMFRAGQNTCQCCDGTRAFNGNMDEISLFNRALSADEVRSIYEAGSAGKCVSVAPPSILTQPPDIAAYVGSAVTLKVEAAGAMPLTYEWFLNSKLVGVTTVPQLVIPDVQMNNNGNYQVVVTNAFGSVKSDKAHLSVSPRHCATIPGLIGWWPGDGNAADRVGAHDGTIIGGLTFTDGEVGGAFAFNGTDSEVDFGRDIGNFGTNDFTVEFWIQTTSTAGLQSCLEKHDICNAGHFWDVRIGNCNGCDNHGTGHMVFEIYGCPNGVACGNWVPVTGGTAINDGVWHHVACVRTGRTSVVYVDGQLDGSGTDPVGVADVTSGAMFRAGQNTCQCCDGTVPFQGNLDEISLYNRALAPREIESIYAAGSIGKCPSSPKPPSILDLIAISRNGHLGAAGTRVARTRNGRSFSAISQGLPHLTATLDNTTNIVLSWPVGSAGFGLESTTPIGTNWAPVVVTPVTNGGNVVVTQPISVEQMFYRLLQP